MSTIRNKQRLIRLYRYLMENTDEDHQATTNDLVAFLREEDSNASRKTACDDIKVLTEEGIDVVTTRSYYNAYFIGNRLFEVPEVELLVGGTAANVSLTIEQKEKMIEKLLGTLSIHQAQKIRDRIVYSGSKNKQSYCNIDRISEAINKDRKIRLQCFDSQYEGNSEIGVCERTCVITPHFMTCCDNCYYVVGRDCGTGEIDVFRIDRITNARILEEAGDPVPGDFGSMEDYLKIPFRMQKGPRIEVVLKCNDEMMGEIMDVFGAGVEWWKSTHGKFCVRVLVCASKAFYAWVFQYGGKINIVSPTSVLRKHAEMVCRAQGGGDSLR